MKNKIKYLVGKDSLLEILELSLDVESSYEQLKSKTENPYIKDWLTLKQELTTDFIMEILNQLQEFEISAQSHSLLKVNFNKLWLDMKLKFINIDDDLIIRECHKIDNIISEALTKEIKSGLITSRIHESYTNYKNKLRLHNTPLTINALNIS